MKKSFKIFIFCLMVAWLPFHLIHAIFPEFEKLTMVFFVIHITAFVVVLIFYLGFSANPHFFKSLEELAEAEKDCIEREKEAHLYIEAIKRLSVNKAGITIDELNNKVKQLKKED